MRTKFAYASRSEKLGKSGDAGDQDGKEVKVAPYYEFGATHILRVLDNDKRHHIANHAQAIAKNELVGYSQNDRYSLYDQLIKVRYINKLSKKCNTDCSQLVACCLLREGFKAFNKWSYTGSMIKDFENCMQQYKEPYKVIKFEKQEQLKKGDILLNPKSHAVVVL